MDGSKVEDDLQRHINDGDWICSDSQCANVNFARRSSCNRCGKDRAESAKKKKLGQEIGKVAAEKSRGLFSADDWQCSKCGNVNWARRQQCNMCNAPKFGEVEERTGYGGGYNDRGVVEYKERQEEDDDEYDEFGRRKKKRKLENKSNNDVKEPKHSNSLKGKSKSDENEDSDDENTKNICNEGENKKYHEKKCQVEKKEEEKEEEEEEEEDEEEEEEEEETEEKADVDEDEDEEDDDDGDLSKYDLTAWDEFSSPHKKTSNGNTESLDERGSR